MRLPLACALITILCIPLLAAEPPEVVNGGFETRGDDGLPVRWKAFGPKNWEFTAEAARTGDHGLRFRPSDAQQWFRQQQPGFDTRAYTVSGWFRAKDFKVGEGKDKHARLYIHVLYQDRPYSDANHFYYDLPTGTYDWRKCSVRIVPKTTWPVSEFWVTLTSQFDAGTLDCDDISIEPATPMGGASVLDWANGANPVVLADMSKCEPAAALADRRLKGKWKVIEYKAGPYEGKMLSANFEQDAAPVTLPLNMSGWHAIYLGIYDGKVRVKLTSDPAYVGRVPCSGSISEIFFKAADLTGESIQFAQQSKGHPHECQVAYVKLVPLTHEEVAQIQADRADLAQRNLATTIDGFSFLWDRGCVTLEELQEETEEYRHSDFGTLYLQMTGADAVNYDTKVGEHLGIDDGKLIPVFPRDGDRIYSESLQERIRLGINATQALIEGAHDVGMTVFATIRPAAWQYPPPMEEFFRSDFYDAHPEWHCVDRDGTPVARMSFAVPEVRAHLISVLREAVQFGADGACVLYNRGLPVVLWEEPFCALFREKYAEDARSVPETDPRLVELRTEIATQFMREIRQMLDAEEARRRDGKRLKIAAMTLANEADNVKYGVDIRKWVDEGLLDEVAPYLGAGGGSAKAYDLEFFAEACGAKGVPWRPTIVAWQAPTVEEMRRLAVQYRDAGAAGVCFWDGNSLTNATDKWAVVSRLGHLEEMRSQLEMGAPQCSWVRPEWLGGMYVGSRYQTTWGF